MIFTWLYVLGTWWSDTTWLDNWELALWVNDVTESLSFSLKHLLIEWTESVTKWLDWLKKRVPLLNDYETWLNDIVTSINDYETWLNDHLNYLRDYEIEWLIEWPEWLRDETEWPVELPKWLWGLTEWLSALNKWPWDLTACPLSYLSKWL